MKNRLAILLLWWCPFAFAELPHFPNTIFFGDSLTDVGNYVSTRSLPLACLDAGAPETNLKGGSYPHTTWANMADEGFASTPSKMGGNNWAIAGSQTSQVYNQADPSHTQIQNYLNKVKIADPNTLYVIWAGANDLIFRVYLKTQEDPNLVIRQGVENIVDGVNALYEAGARNFLVIGVPDISRTPLAENDNEYGSASWSIAALLVGVLYDERAQLADICDDWNKTLFATKNSPLLGKSSLLRLTQVHPDIQIYTWNPAPLLEKVASDPADYGFQAKLTYIDGLLYPNNEITWCHGKVNNSGDLDANPDDYMFFNFIHPTNHTHHLLAHYVQQEAQLFSRDLE